MKIDSRRFHVALVLATAVAGASAYVPSKNVVSNRHSAALASTKLYSSTSADADFSAFADSLEADDKDQVTSKATVTNKKSTRSGTTTSADKPWQAKLEELFDPMTTVAQRQILLSELLNANEKIRESVLDALTNRKVRAWRDMDRKRIDKFFS
jgi:hypothetical protein